MRTQRAKAGRIVPQSGRLTQAVSALSARLTPAGLSLVLDSSNTPYLAYPGGGAMANKATVMKYYTVLPPADFNKTAPTNAATEVNPNASLSWAPSDGAASYEYCYDTTNNNACDTSWISAGTNTSVSLPH